LRFKANGQRRVLLVDAELPKVQLQERLKEFTGASERFKILSPELMKNERAFPNLSQVKDQAAFLEQIEDFQPNVIIFDTLTRCFRFDTNDADSWLKVNDFLIDLRSRGYCVILIHHGGKNGTQRGRTDGDDNLDVSVMLEKPYAWQPGDGLAFKWSYVKVRHGGYLPEFEADYNLGWHIREDERVDRIREMLAEGKTERAIAKELDIAQATVNRIKRRMGLDRLNGPDS
jgi:putative DNA primase/helicase